MSYKLIPKDATTPNEKAAYLAMNLVAPGLYLFMVLSACQVFKNMYQNAVANAGWGWFVAGLLLSGVLGYTVYKFANDENVKIGKLTIKPSIGFVALLAALSLLTYAGFTSPYRL